MFVNSGHLSLRLFVVHLLAFGVAPLIVVTMACSNDKSNNPQSTTSAVGANIAETTKNPLTDLTVAAVAGKPLYAANCASCHGTNGKGDSDFGASLSARPSDLTTSDVVSHPDGKIFLVIKNGKMKNGKITMPPARGVTDEQIWQIVSYVRTLAENKKRTE